MSAHDEVEPVLEPTSVSSPQRPAGSAVRAERIALVDLLDRVLAGGVVISGEVRLAIADVDLVNVSLRAMVSSVSSLLEHGAPDSEGLDRKDDS